MQPRQVIQEVRRGPFCDLTSQYMDFVSKGYAAFFPAFPLDLAWLRSPVKIKRWQSQ